MTDKYTKEFYLETYNKIDKKLLFNKSQVSKNYINDTKQLFKNALDAYFSNKRVYDSTKLPKQYRNNGKLKTRMGNDKFYKFLSIIVDYTNNNPKEINKIKSLENKFVNAEIIDDFLNDDLDKVWSDENILYYQDKIIYLYKRLSVLQENCNTIDGIPTKDSSEEEYDTDEDELINTKLQVLAFDSIKQNKTLNEELIKKEMPEFYKKENEKGRIPKILEICETIKSNLLDEKV